MDSQWDIFALNLFLGMRHLLAFMWILLWWNAEGGNFALMQSRWHSSLPLPLPFLQTFRTALTKNQYSMTWEVSPNKMFYKAKCVALAFSSGRASRCVSWSWNGDRGKNNLWAHWECVFCIVIETTDCREWKEWFPRPFVKIPLWDTVKDGTLFWLDFQYDFPIWSTAQHPLPLLRYP